MKSSIADGAELDDLELLRRWREGDVRCGNVLVHRYFDTLYRFFRGRVDDGVADLVQRTLTACVERHTDITVQHSFRAFLLGVAHKELLRLLRKETRRKRAMERERGGAAARSAISPSRHAALREEKALLLHALRGLSTEHQVALELYYWEELSLEEIAVVLDVAEGTVKSRLFRAKQSLRDAIHALEADPALVESTLTGLDDWVRAVRRDAVPKGDARER